MQCQTDDFKGAKYIHKRQAPTSTTDFGTVNKFSSVYGRLSCMVPHCARRLVSAATVERNTSSRSKLNQSAANVNTHTSNTALACLRTPLGMLSRRLSIARMMLPCPQISTVFPALMRGTMRSLQNSHDRAWASLRDSVLGLPHHEAGISSTVENGMTTGQTERGQRQDKLKGGE